MRLPLPAQAALADLQRFYATHQHRPSAQQWDGIKDLLDHLQRAADGSLAPAVYLSTLPAGTGKSTTIQAFARALCNAPRYASVGTLIGCNRVEEVAAMAIALQSHRQRLCVIVGKANVAELAMGDHTEANDAQIVLTTQAALRMTLQGKKEFDRATRYQYRGQRRAVICWDEAMAFNHPVVIDGDTVGGLAKLFRGQSEGAANALLRWAVAIAEAPKEPSLFAVPDFEGLGVDFRYLEEDAGDGEYLIQIKALRALSGDSGWLVPGTYGASALVTHIPVVPASIMPVIVTDASGASGVHGCAYEQMGTTVHVVRLKEAPKTYGNLTINIVPTAASRSTYKDRSSTKGRELIHMAADYIKQQAPESVLVVSYNNTMTMRGVNEKTIAQAIGARLTSEERDRVGHITWGRHTATNTHEKVHRVVLMGLNYTPRTAGHAASGAALNKPMRTADAGDHPTNEQADQMRQGMLRDATFQAILRGHARKSLDGDCGPMEVLIFQSMQTGLSVEDYVGMFPGAVIKVDDSMLPSVALTGRLLALSGIVIRRIEAGEHEMTNPSLWDELGMRPEDFRKLTKKDKWTDWLAANGLQGVRLVGMMKGIRKLG